MTAVMRDPAGRIIAVSARNASDASLPGDWEPIADDAPELIRFLDQEVSVDAFAQSDSNLIRVLEDLIDLLIDRGVIVFTDLPIEAQRKLSERQSRRTQLRKVSLVDDDADLL